MKTVVTSFAALVCGFIPVRAQSGESVPLLIKCQGRLHNGEELLNGPVKMTLRVYPSAVSGKALYEDTSTVNVIDGIYSTFLGDDTVDGDLMNALDAGEAYLEITANGTTFAPRERLLTVPYALIAKAVVKGGITEDMVQEGTVLGRHIGEGSITSDKLGAGVVTPDKLSDEVKEMLKVTEGLWSTAGNRDTKDELMVLGTLDETPLDLTVAGQRALRLRPNPVAPNLIGGHAKNKTDDDAVGSVLAGGGSDDAPNHVTGDFGFLGGGEANQVGGAHSVVGGGWENHAFGNRSTVAGGRNNRVEKAGAAVGGGYSNIVSESYGVVAGGNRNRVAGYVANIAGGWSNAATGSVAAVLGGMNNQALGNASSVGGGFNNVTIGDGAHIGGGSNNVARGAASVVPGGIGNRADGDHSVALGTRAQAGHRGSIVISDAQPGPFASTGENQILMRAGGGVGINTAKPTEALEVAGNVKADTIIAKAFQGDGSKLTGIGLQDGSVQAKHLAPGFKLPAGAVAAGAITEDKLDADLLARVTSGTTRTAWQLGGNEGTTAGKDYLGTADDVPLELRAGGLTGMWIVPVKGGTGIAIAPPETAVAVHKHSFLFNGRPGEDAETTREGQVVLMAPNNVGINTPAPTEALTVAGNVLAERFIGDGSMLTNLNLDALAGDAFLTEDTRFAGDVVGTATNLRLRPGSVKTATLAPNSVTDAAIAANAKINPTKINGTALTMATPLGGDITGNARAARIKPGAITANHLSPELRQSLDKATRGPEAAPGLAALPNPNPEDPTLRVGSDKNAPMEFVAQGKPFLRAQPGAESPNLTLGFGGNAVVATAKGGTISGGGNPMSPNEVSADYGTVSGGHGNRATQANAAVGGGTLNVASGLAATVGGGSENQTRAQASTIGGGQQNLAAGSATTIGGGFDNQAEGEYATVPGGFGNRAKGNFSLAAGRNAQALHAGAFVWADGQEAAFASTAADQFLIQAGGGVGIGTTQPTEALTVAGNIAPDLAARHSLGTVDLPWKHVHAGAIEYREQFRIQSGGKPALRIDDRANTTLDGDLLPGAPDRASLGSGNLAWKTVHTAAIGFGESFAIVSDGEPRFEIQRDGRVTAAGFRVEPAGESPNLVFGHEANQVDAKVSGGLVMGGGKAGKPNIVASDYGTVGGGLGNRVSGYNTTVAGGEDNRAEGLASTIGGGFTNRADGKFSTVAGGAMNQAVGDFTTVAGGVENQALGVCAAVLGGSDNEAAGDYTIALGRQAKATHNGSIVIADGIGSDLGTSGENQFVARASGGVFFLSSGDGASGVALAPGSGSWASLSDRAAKRDLRPVDPGRILERVAALPLYDYEYKAQAEGVRHIGPTAQDFHAAFGVGCDERRITTADADGVALAAIQGLAGQLREKDQRIAALETRIDTLSRQLEQVAELMLQAGCATASEGPNSRASRREAGQ